MKKNLPLTLIFLVVFIDLLGFGILIPILPTFAVKVLSMNESSVGIVVAIYSLTQFLFNPLFGSLSDRFGRRNIILISLLLNAAGYIVFAFTHSFLMLIISRVIAGIGGSSIGVAQAYIADVTTVQERAKGMGLIGVAFGLGFVFGPMLGGIFSKFGYEVTGFASASFSILAFILSYFYLPESLKNLASNVTTKARKLLDIKAFTAVFQQKSSLFVITLTFFLTFSVANIYGTFAILGSQQFGYTDFDNGMLFGIMGIVSAIMQGFLMGKLTKMFSQLQLLIIGFTSLALGLALIPYGSTFLLMSLILGLMSVGTGALQPILLSLISQVASEAEQGMVLGLNQSLSSLARVLGPLWGGFAFQYLGYQIPFFTGAVVSGTLLFYCYKNFNIHIKPKISHV
ncbi:tetracycline resistance MFS efflux pump [Ignavibacteriales bacterium]